MFVVKIVEISTEFLENKHGKCRKRKHSNQGYVYDRIIMLVYACSYCPRLSNRCSKIKVDIHACSESLADLSFIGIMKTSNSPKFSKSQAH